MRTYCVLISCLLIGLVQRKFSVVISISCHMMKNRKMDVPTKLDLTLRWSQFLSERLSFCIEKFILDRLDFKMAIYEHRVVET
mmetsp:Transcript_13219/g.21999  ORF Transcript_13219/g.21999 Transcript_13219/m.21999 type:complete len:83 (+) Transcript_13219:823-1071(+)